MQPFIEMQCKVFSTHLFSAPLILQRVAGPDSRKSPYEAS